MKEESFYGILSIIAVFFSIVTLAISIWVSQGKKLAKQWKEVARGIYERAEYGFEVHTSRSGAMVHTTHRYKRSATIIIFNDERTYVCEGERLDMPFSKGREVKILQNGLGRHKVEAMQISPAFQIPCS